jgi:Flp pilus assembly pilin Flp
MKLLLEETGQGMAEYALILAFVAMAVITALGFMGTAITNSFVTAKELFD